MSLVASSLSAQDALTTAQPNIALTITGDIPSAVILKAEEISKMPRETSVVTDHDGSKISYEGIPLREVLKRAGVPLGKELRGKAMASYILAKAHDGYQVVFSLGEIDASFGNELILVADKRDGKPLFGDQGPLRLVCPNGKAGARSVRMLETGTRSSEKVEKMRWQAVASAGFLIVQITQAARYVERSSNRRFQTHASREGRFG